MFRLLTFLLPIPLVIISCNVSTHAETITDNTEKNHMKEIIHSSDAPAPIGPYSQATMHAGVLYVSGQIAIDPKTGTLDTGSIGRETELVMSNLSAVLKAADMDFSNVLKCSIFLSDMGNFAQVNEVYARYFPENPPARETVAVKTLPKSVNVEISCIAAK